VTRGSRIEPFAVAHIDAVAELLARRQRVDRERVPALPEAFTVAVAVQPLVLELAGSSGVIAFRGAELVGCLLGEPMAFPPDSPIAPYYRPGSILVRYHAHAALDDTYELYRALYAAAASAWIADGLPVHCVQLPADPVALDAWASLGFGREVGWALRDTSPLPTPEASSVRVRRATLNDIDVVCALDAALTRFEAGAPVCLPCPAPAADAVWRADLATSLADPDAYHWLAELGGVPVGLMSFVAPPRHISPLLTPQCMVNIPGASVAPEARSVGVGAALLRHGLADARQRGMDWCRLSWMTANLVSSRFWARQGFQPVAYRVVRVVDDRMLR
jgi:ribosomal protein S18 acetylase RimI-like enzyme